MAKLLPQDDGFDSPYDPSDDIDFDSRDMGRVADQSGAVTQGGETNAEEKPKRKRRPRKQSDSGV